MSNQRFTPEEQLFLREVGLAPDHVELLPSDAPSLPAATVRRLQAQARPKAGLAGTTTPLPLRPPRWLAAAAAVVLALAASLAVLGPERVQAALQRLMHYVPGIGIAATDDRTLVLAAPVEAVSDGRRLTVTGVLGDSEGTAIHLRIDGLPEGHKKVEPGPPPTLGAQAALTLPDGTRFTGSYSFSGSTG